MAADNSQGGFFARKQAFFAASALSLFALLLLSGCTSKVVPEDSFNAGPNSTFNLSAYANPNADTGKELSTPTPCTCMFCKNTSMTFLQTVWNRIRSVFGAGDLETTLAYGNCSFTPCNASIFGDVMLDDTPDRYPRYFMMGQGASSGEYSLAQRYCNGSLTMPVLWAVGNASSPPKAPGRKLAECYLLRNQMPVVVFRNNNPSQPIPLSAWESAAKSYRYDSGSESQIGPVIITTEALFNSSDQAALSRVQSQIDAIRRNCPRCLVALAVSDMDKEGVDYFLNSSRLNYNSSIDLVGLGFIANDNAGEKRCSVTSSLGLRQRFSYSILRNYGKPSVWYALGIANGSTSMEGCSFSNLDVRNGWEWVGQNIVGLEQSGIIGVAPYRFLDTGSSPLPCDPAIHSCDFGFKDINGMQKDQSFYGWFRQCQFYTTDTTFDGVKISVNSSEQPIVFSTNGMGMACSFADTPKMGVLASIRMGQVQATPAIPDPDYSLQKRVADLSCGSCISSVPMPKGFCYRKGQSGTSFSSSFCQKFPQIEDAVLAQQFDPLVMRAVVAGESSFDNCAVSNASLTAPCGGQKNCGDLEFFAYSKYPGTTEPFCSSGQVESRCNAIQSTGSNQKVCALGLFQCIENPGNDPTPGKICNGNKYNPFNPYDSACCGTFKFKDAYDKYLAALNSALIPGSNLRNVILPGEEEWYAAWLATRDYYGTGPSLSMMQSYASQSGATPEGMVKYVEDTLMASYGNRHYGSNLILRYNDAIDTCGGGCPFQECR